MTSGAAIDGCRQFRANDDEYRAWHTISLSSHHLVIGCDSLTAACVQLHVCIENSRSYKTIRTTYALSSTLQTIRLCIVLTYCEVSTRPEVRCTRCGWARG